MQAAGIMYRKAKNCTFAHRCFVHTKLYSGVACGTDWLKMQRLGMDLLGREGRGRGVLGSTRAFLSPLSPEQEWGGWHQLRGRSLWLQLCGFPASPAVQSCTSLQCPTSPSLLSLRLDRSCLAFSRGISLWQMSLPKMLPSLFGRVLQDEGTPGPQPSCPAHEDWRAQLAGTLLFQQNRTSQCCWLLRYIFPDRALAIKIDAIIHMDSCNCKRHSKSKNRIHSLTQTYPQSVRMWHIGSASVPNYECHYLLFFWRLFTIVTFTVN